MILYMYDTGQSHPQRGILLVSCCLKGTLSHFWYTDTRVDRKNINKNIKILFLIGSYAEWQGCCSFCAVVVVSLAHEDQVEKWSERLI